ncbi:FAD-dependent oxidoreductase [uncultured Corynebacterium sp.]|uniref:FAD-dependent oxidoreductase n=1 Tax=uncultured Corynebacterium sp. TaxID=159447 RepID=UPI0025EC35F8|nr:NAD(P)/FAD-dependent oxidoreductase [uncultured Corynebacterium sp.]
MTTAKDAPGTAGATGATGAADDTADATAPGAAAGTSAGMSAEVPSDGPAEIPADRRAALEELAARVREDLETTDPNTAWSLPRDTDADVAIGSADPAAPAATPTGASPAAPAAASGAADLSVAVIGGGQAGLASAFALRRAGIAGVLVFDAAEPDSVGCWADYARMHTLRSPKHMRGIELDCPSLHVRRWYEARHGADAWEGIDLIPRLEWNDYLAWFRDTAGIEVKYGTRVEGVVKPEHPGGAFTLRLSDGTSTTARRVVYALGLDGGGERHVPDMVSDLPRDRWNHTADAIDFAALRGKRVAVLGGGASGFDNAACALEAGAAHVTVHMRRDAVPDANPLRWMEFPGMQDHFPGLTDVEKWEFGQFNGGLPQPPTQASIWRCMGLDGFRLALGSRWSELSVRDDDPSSPIRIRHHDGTEEDVDHVIAATGYRVNLAARPELAEFVDDIALWSDVHEWADGPLAACPYLGDGFQFTPKAGAPEWIGRMFHLSTGARASMGVSGNQLSGIYSGVRRLAWRVTADVTAEKWPALFEDFRGFRHVEIHSVAPHGPGDDPYPRAPRQ